MTLVGWHDRRGLPLSTRSPVALERYDEAVERSLSGNLGREEKLREAIAADEGFALAYAALALVQQYDGAIAAARESAARAVTLASGTTRREQQHARAVAAAVGEDGPGALGLIHEHLAEFPRDALLLLQTAPLLTFSGRADRNTAQLAFLETLAPAYGDDWFFLGAVGFFHHELDHFGESRRLSERSLDLYPRNSLAAHSLAHVFYETSDPTAGRAFLEGWMAGYPAEAPVHCHLSWHQALFELLAGRTSRVLDLYASEINPTLIKARTLLSDSASLLWRLQIYGCADHPLPWAGVCDLAARTTPGFAFADAHSALAYAGAGDAAAMGALVDGIEMLATQGNTVAAEVALPLVRGIDAFGRGAYADAVEHLEPVMRELIRLGGSNAQREVFEDTLLQAYLRAGRFEAAETLLNKRLGRRHSARDFFWLGRAQTAMGHQAEGTQSLDQAARTWSDAEPGTPEVAELRRARQSDESVEQSARTAT